MTEMKEYLADTVVVNETQSLMNARGVVPVMSSHCAGLVPPSTTANTSKLSEIQLTASSGILITIQTLTLRIIATQHLAGMANSLYCEGSS